MSCPLTDEEISTVLVGLEEQHVFMPAGRTGKGESLWRLDVKGVRALFEALSAIDLDKSLRGVAQCESCSLQADEETRDLENWGYDLRENVWRCAPCLDRATGVTSE